MVDEIRRREEMEGRSPPVIIVMRKNELMYAMNHHSEVWHQLLHTAANASGHACGQIDRVRVNVRARLHEVGPVRLRKGGTSGGLDCTCSGHYC
jgi:hypothetical protein